VPRPDPRCAAAPAEVFDVLALPILRPAWTSSSRGKAKPPPGSPTRATRPATRRSGPTTYPRSSASCPRPDGATAAATHPERAPVAVADAAHLPFADRSFDLVVAFMVLHDVDAMEEAVAEAARVTSEGGRICIAITHPIQGIGDFAGPDRRGRYVIERPYFEPRRLTYSVGEGPSRVALHFRYRPLSAYTGALERAGLLIESLREPPPPEDAGLPDFEQRRLVPSFLHIRSVRP
jgi:SAM-dependent methyltransferase